MAGLISRHNLQRNKFTEPVLFYSARRRLPRSLEDVSIFLDGINGHQTIASCTNPSALSHKAKRLLDKGYHDKIEIKAIASRLKTQPAVLSRAFKADYGATPAFYRKGLRVTVGMYELMMGAPPVRAAELAGYSDLGRFYKQFKAYLKQTPAEYSQKSKNAKNSKSK